MPGIQIALAAVPSKERQKADSYFRLFQIFNRGCKCTCALCDASLAQDRTSPCAKLQDPGVLDLKVAARAAQPVLKFNKDLEPLANAANAAMLEAATLK